MPPGLATTSAEYHYMLLHLTVNLFLLPQFTGGTSRIIDNIKYKMPLVYLASKNKYQEVSPSDDQCSFGTSATRQW